MKRILGALILALSACSPAPQSGDPIPVEGEPRTMAEAPADVLAAINDQLPGFVATNVVSDNSTGAQGYRIDGTANDGTYNVQLIHANEGWNVVVIRREMAWVDAPQAVGAALLERQNEARDLFTPVRVVEVRESGVEGVLYEVYDPEAPPNTPIVIRLVDGEAAVMPPAH